MKVDRNFGLKASSLGEGPLKVKVVHQKPLGSLHFKRAKRHI
jgi:hypothetical protein